MSKSKSLLGNTLIYTIGTFGAKMLTFLLLPFFSFYLAKSDLGIYDLVLTTVSLFVPLVSLQLSSAVYRWLLNNSEDRRKKSAISNSFIVLTAGMLIFEIIYHSISSFLYLQYSNYISLLILVSSYLPYFQNVVRGLGQTRLYATASIINAIFLLFFNVFFLVVLKLKLEALFIAILISNIITIGFLIYRGGIVSNISLNYMDKEEVKAMLSFSLPLVPNMISWWVINAADKYVILYFLTTEMNGIYAISSRFPTILTLLNSVFLLAWQDHVISSENNNSDSDFDNKIFETYFKFELCLILILIASSHIIIDFTVDSQYIEAYKYMPLLYLGVGYSAFAGYYGANFLKLKKTKVIFVSSIVAGLLNIVIAFLLMKYIGLFASAMGTFVGYVIMFLIRVKQTKTYFDIRININLLIGLTILCLVYSYLVLLENNIVTGLMLIISILITLFLNKSIISQFYKYMINKYIS